MALKNSSCQTVLQTTILILVHNLLWFSHVIFHSIVVIAIRNLFFTPIFPINNGYNKYDVYPLSCPPSKTPWILKNIQRDTEIFSNFHLLLFLFCSVFLFGCFFFASYFLFSDKNNCWNLAIFTLPSLTFLPLEIFSYVFYFSQASFSNCQFICILLLFRQSSPPQIWHIGFPEQLTVSSVKNAVDIRKQQVSGTI